jgi:putative transcriptional regulator
LKNRLKQLRAENGWTQADLGARLGVSRQTIIAIEKGKFDPSLPLAFKLARIFQRPIEAIFSDQVSIDSSAIEDSGARS